MSVAINRNVCQLASVIKEFKWNIMHGLMKWVARGRACVQDDPPEELIDCIHMMLQLHDQSTTV